MNPELLRLARLELSPLRLASAPVMVVAVAGIWMIDDPTLATFNGVLAGVILLVAIFWGARRAADAVASELRERTWDTQRTSGAAPRAMTLGKLFGAPLGAWYVIGVCVLLQLAALVLFGDGARPAFLLTSYALSYEGLLLQLVGAFAVFAIAGFAAMSALAGQQAVRGLDTTLFQILAVVSCFWIGTQVSELFVIRLGGADAVVAFWGLALSRETALTLTYGFFGAWAAYGYHHQMLKAFGARATALPWIVFLAALALFLAGWSGGAYANMLAFLALCYGAALIEPQRSAAYRRWLGAAGSGAARALVSAPAWLYAWIALALSVAYLASDLSAGARLDADGIPPWEGAAAALFVLRDMGICVWAGLRARDGRGLWSAAGPIAILWAVGFALGDVAEDSLAHALFAPLGPVSALSAALQALLAFALVAAARRSAPLDAAR